MPRYTVVTATWNSAATLARTLESVRAQTLTDYEHLIVDNASSDGTQAIAAGFCDTRIRVISEPDRGLYDAMNKGIAAARGELVAILNSDDVYADAQVLADVEQVFREQRADVVYGDLDFVDARGRVKRHWTAGAYREARWREGWHPPHPSTFISKAAYELIAPSPRESGERVGVRGYYDTRYKLSADYKLELALGLVHHARYAYLPRVLVRMALGGVSTRGLGPIVRSNREVLKAWKDLGLRAPRMLIPRKLAYKLKGKLLRR